MPESALRKISNTLEEIRDILTGDKSSKLGDTINGSLQNIASSNIVIEELVKESFKEIEENKSVSLSGSLSHHRGDNIDDLMKNQDKTLNKIYDVLFDMKNVVSTISKKSNFKFSSVDDKKIIENIINEKNDHNSSNKFNNLFNIISKLSNIKIKDLITSRIKIKQINKIYDKLLETFKKFKDDKEFEKINKFAMSSIDLIENIAKINKHKRAAEKGAKAIDTIFFGKFGIVNTLERMKENNNEIKDAKKLVDDMLVISGKLLLISTIMSGVALLAIPAMAGTLLMSGVLLGFGLTFSLLGLIGPAIKKGDVISVEMMAAVVLAGAALLLLNKATKDLEWEQLGKAGTAILGFGLIAAVLGIPPIAACISLGGASLALLGISLIAIGGGIGLFNLMVSDDAIDKVEYGLSRIIGMMMGFFGGEDGGTADFGESFASVITGCMRFGGIFVASAALIMLGIALGLCGLSLRTWENFPMGAIDNITETITKLDDALGLGLKTNRHSGEGLKNQFKGVASDIMGFASTLLQSGSTFVSMGAILVSGIVLWSVKGMLEKWKNFDVTSLDNINTAVTRLDNIFGLGIKHKTETTNAGAWSTAGVKIGNAIGDTFGLISTLMNAGGMFLKMGALLVAVYTTKLFVEQMEKLQKVSLDDKKLKKLFNSVDKFSKFFGIDLHENSDEDSGFWSNVGGIFTGAVGTISNTLQLGAELGQTGQRFAKLSMLMMAVGVVNLMVDAMIKAGENSDKMEGSLDKVFGAFDKMIEYFFNDDRLDGSIFDGLKTIGSTALGALIAGPIGALGGAMLSGDSRTTRLSLLTMSVGIVDKMAEALIKIGKITGDVDASLQKVFTSLNKVINYFFKSSGKNASNALSRIGASVNAAHSNSDNLFEMVFGDGSSPVETQLEVLTSCIGVVGVMADALTNMKSVAPDLDKTIDNIFYTFGKLTDYFFGPVNNEKQSALKRVANAMKAHSSKGMFFDDDGSSAINTQLEIITTCVGVVSEVSKTLQEMKSKDDMETSLKNITTSMDTIVKFFLGHTKNNWELVDTAADLLPDIIENMIKSVNYFNDSKMNDGMKNLEIFALNSITHMKTIITEMKVYTEDELDDVEDIVDELPDIFGPLSKVLKYLKGDYESSFNNIKKLCDTFGVIKLKNASDLEVLGSSIKPIADSLIRYSRNVTHKMMTDLNKTIKLLNIFGKNSKVDMFKPIEKVVDKINTIDIEKATALKDTFRAFNEMSKIDETVDKFKEQVKLFTDACVRLVDAINGNTDALLVDGESTNESYSSSPQEHSVGVNISNTMELAEAISDAIRNRSFGGGGSDGVQVDLRINGDGGDSWIIRKY